MENFAKDSTHGACPVGEGEKCVIQQWISRSKKLPLRDERLAAIFPCGADNSYRKILDADQRHGNDNKDSDDKYCMKDLSAKQGAYASQLCLIQESTQHQQSGNELDRTVVNNDKQGPYVGVGALRVAKGLSELAILPFPFGRNTSPTARHLCQWEIDCVLHCNESVTTNPNGSLYCRMNGTPLQKNLIFNFRFQTSGSGIPFL